MECPEVVSGVSKIRKGEVSNVEVTVRYHLMTHTLFLAILCLTTVFDDYLSIVSITYLLPITD